MIRTYSSVGLTHDQIASIYGIKPPTFDRMLEREPWLREMINVARLSADAKVMETLYNMAVSGEHPAATFFYLKTRCGWREKDVDDEKPVTVTLAYNPSRLLEPSPMKTINVNNEGDSDE